MNVYLETIGVIYIFIKIHCLTVISIYNKNKCFMFGGIALVFKSKIDLWMGAIFALLPIIMISAVIEEPSVMTIVITILLIGMLVAILFGTKYVIEGEDLIIYGGLYKKKIAINQITSLRPTKNPLSAPALSLDRIEITFNPAMRLALVSPKDKETFVKKLIEINPSIKLAS